MNQEHEMARQGALDEADEHERLALEADAWGKRRDADRLALARATLTGDRATLAAHLRGFMAALESAHPFRASRTVSYVLTERLDWIENEREMGAKNGLPARDKAWGWALDRLEDTYKMGL